MQMLHIASQLTYLAVAANFGSIFTVIICLAAMILFIRQFRLHEFEPTGSSVVQVKQLASEQLLSKINLPFFLEIGKLDSSDSGIYHLTLYSTSYFPCLFVVCREMSSDRVKNLINEPWQKFLEVIRSEMKVCPNLQIYAEEDVHELKPFFVKGALDCIPRIETYALVVFHIRTDVEYITDKDPAAIITLIHTPDRYCNAPATTLCQYLKCSDGRVLNLKPLYSPENTMITNGREDLKQSNVDRGNTNCVICWNFPATHVLLPCRHACLCVNCFKRVENCPVCRTHVLSFFLV